jgi:hypothetical protein
MIPVGYACLPQDFDGCGARRGYEDHMVGCKHLVCQFVCALAVSASHYRLCKVQWHLHMPFLSSCYLHSTRYLHHMLHNTIVSTLQKLVGFGSQGFHQLVCKLSLLFRSEHTQHGYPSPSNDCCLSHGIAADTLSAAVLLRSTWFAPITVLAQPIGSSSILCLLYQCHIVVLYL